MSRSDTMPNLHLKFIFSPDTDILDPECKIPAILQMLFVSTGCDFFAGISFFEKAKFIIGEHKSMFPQVLTHVNLHDEAV